jgi:ABC-type antimicrobial peptide transport system permease subunit
MTLAMAAGAYAVGMAALSWLVSAGAARFPFWVAGLVLVAGAMLVLTVAALAVLERQDELLMVRALGARRQRLWQLVLLEYSIVALGGGGVGALLALLNWVAAGQHHQWLGALALVVADLIGALLSAWLGAAPILWRLRRRSLVGQVFVQGR